MDDLEGFTVHILPPEKIDASGYRKGMIDADDESRNVDGIMFAATEHGDCFCFDAQEGRKEYAVYLFQHEGGYFEAYTDNFVQCLRRWAEAAE